MTDKWAELRRLEKEASPGPWHHLSPEIPDIIYGNDVAKSPVAKVFDWDSSERNPEADAAFITLARNTVKDLLAERDEMMAALEAAKFFGSQGETHEGVSVSYLIEKALGMCP